MTTPTAAAVARSTVIERPDAGRAALAAVGARLRASRGAGLAVPALLLLVVEWLLGVPVAVCVLLAVAMACLLVAVRFWVGRRRYARIFPAGERLTVTAGPDGLVIARGDEAPLVDARWRAFGGASVVRDHLVLTMRGSTALLVLPAAMSDAELVGVVRTELAGSAETPDAKAAAATTEVAGAPAGPPVAAQDAVVDSERVSSAVLDPGMASRMAWDFTVQSMTRPAALAAIALLVALSVLVYLTAETAARWVVPVVTIAFVVSAAALGHVRIARMLQSSPAERVTLTFDESGFVSSSDAGTGRVRYSDLRSVAARRQTVLLRGRNGLTSIYPRSLFPPHLLDEVRHGIARAGAPRG